MRSVVVFGAGMVAKPHLRYLLDLGLKVTVASLEATNVADVIASSGRGSAIEFDVAEESNDLASIIADHDVVVSLLPFQYHARVAEACIACGKDMVTTSYVQDDMKELHGPAIDAGVMLLNEVGVDPGIDHMTAMRIIDRVHAQGGTITGFQSYCGGLPAPEANDNPLGYKISWSPRGVILAGLRDARFRMDGAESKIAGDRLFDHLRSVRVEVAGRVIGFEGYPNRDSLSYASYYGIDPADTMFRGTLRFPNWCATMKRAARLGWLRTDEMEGLEGASYRDLTARLAGADGGENLEAAVADALEIGPHSVEIDCLRWLGLFSGEPLPGAAAPVDILTHRMLEKLPYGEGERDMVVIQHSFHARYPDRSERITSTMVDFGISGGDSSMSRTVGLPAAVAARLVLEGKFQQPGVVVPVMAELYEPVLDELSRLGISFTESVEVLPE